MHTCLPVLLYIHLPTRCLYLFAMASAAPPQPQPHSRQATYADRVSAGQGRSTKTGRRPLTAPAPLTNDQRREAVEKIAEGIQALRISSLSDLRPIFDEARKVAPNLKTPSSSTICIYDLETTGLGKTQDIGIVEIGAIVVIYTQGRGWQEVASFHRLW